MASTNSGSPSCSWAPSWNSGLFLTTSEVACLPSTCRAKPSRIAAWKEGDGKCSISLDAIWER